MKKLLLLLFLSVTVPSIAEEATSLIVHSKDGSSVAYALSEYPKVTFEDSYLLIKSTNIDVSYPLSDMWKFTFEPVDIETAINAVSADKSSFSYADGAIVLSGLNGKSFLQVYTIDGVLRHSEKINTSTFIYPFSELPSGIYIINVNGKTFKISKK